MTASNTARAGAPESRRGWLLAAIQRQAQPVTTAQAARLYAASPWPSSGRNTTRKDLRSLVARGDLAATDTARGRTYTPRKDHAR
ncbi:hypothetical protein [Streptomyces sp. NPDC050560]|uniref:hypothetical protein n=1 Tax=Streptomyces sp. NPDC050560 TaxID=3365630 RepID=UPI0037B3D041